MIMHALILASYSHVSTYGGLRGWVPVITVTAVVIAVKLVPFSSFDTGRVIIRRVHR